MAFDATAHVLKFQQGGEAREIPLKETLLIGREAQCDVTINDPRASRQHARLQVKPDGVWLTDLNSTNGTRVEGMSLPGQTPRRLLPGQTFVIGDMQFCITTRSAQPLSYTIADEVPETRLDVEASGGHLLYFAPANQNNWQRLPINEREITIGRSPDCTLNLDDSLVSRHHASIQIDTVGTWLIDLGSINGTQIDDHPISPRQRFPLRPGQIFTIGSCRLMVQNGESPAPAAAPAAAAVSQPRSAAPAQDAQTRTGTDVSLSQQLSVLRLDMQEHITFGRASDNHVVLPSPQVSRYHAIIDRLGKRYRIRDLNSANGIFVNEERIRGDAWLGNNDRIQIGPYVFILNEDQFGLQKDEGIRIEARNLRQQVSARVNLLQNISLTIQPMEFVAIVGMSGSGKTTLLNALSGYRPATHGKILANGIDLYSSYDRLRNEIGYVPQRDIVHPELTVQEALDYAGQLRMPPDTSSEERKTRVGEVMADLGLTERRNVQISRLSGGQVKRVSIGVELLTRPRLFFLDEPTSGLDPGTEYEMMKLLRRLADQGRTIMLVTHATKNVMMCDKVIFMTSGGYLAYYGPPEEALTYFDQYRTPRERREKTMEFDDIYNILNDEQRGTSKDWAERYLHYKNWKEANSQAVQTSQKRPRLQRRARVSALRQFFILTARNFRILLADKASVLLLLILAPAIGLLDFTWGHKLYDAVDGSPQRIISMWWVTAIVCLMVGALVSVREIVKEAEIYKRERAINLKILPYLLSKVVTGVLFALYSAAILFVIRMLLVGPPTPYTWSLPAYYLTFFLGIFCGYLTGLAISAIAPNPQSANILLIAALVPQFIFGGMLPLREIPGGTTISMVVPVRWTLEAFIRSSGFGEKLMNDPCWAVPKDKRAELTSEDKAECACMGANMFTQCLEYPGILSRKNLTDAAKAALDQPEPEQPEQPSTLPSPTPLPTPKPMDAPEVPYLYLSDPPSDPTQLEAYLREMQFQTQSKVNDYGKDIDDFAEKSREQADSYSQKIKDQMQDYSEGARQQIEEYQNQMKDYSELRANWEKDRQRAISSQEGIMAQNFDNFSLYFSGSILYRWGLLILLTSISFIATVIFQKRKDII